MKTVFMILFMFGVIGMSAAEDKPLTTVPSVDLRKYMGRWYEIAAFPQRFEKGCHCTVAEYSMEKDFVRVINTCRKDTPDGKVSQARGKAFVVKGSNNAKLRVQFFWPFRGDYWIIDLAEDYSYAVVGAPGRDYLWILCRTPQMDEGLYQEIVKRCADKAFDIGKLVRTDQTCAAR
jgi:apolipoprotein D and lipocalin family protein